MSKLTEEFQLVWDEVVDMTRLTHLQLSKSFSALTNFDKDLAREVVMGEKRVNAAELKIDRDCADIIAFNAPVTGDLRFLFAVLKINTNLERIGDIADGIARLLINEEHPFSQELVDSSQVVEMYGEALQIVEALIAAFEKEDSALTRSIYKRNEFLNSVNRNANTRIIQFLQDHPGEIHQALNILSIMGKLQRVGDQAENIAKEVIFFSGAKVLRYAS